MKMVCEGTATISCRELGGSSGISGTAAAHGLFARTLPGREPRFSVLFLMLPKHKEGNNNKNSYTIGRLHFFKIKLYKVTVLGLKNIWPVLLQNKSTIVKLQITLQRQLSF